MHMYATAYIVHTHIALGIILGRSADGRVESGRGSDSMHRSFYMEMYRIADGVDVIIEYYNYGLDNINIKM